MRKVPSSNPVPFRLPVHKDLTQLAGPLSHAQAVLSDGMARVADWPVNMFWDELEGQAPSGMESARSVLSLLRGTAIDVAPGRPTVEGQVRALELLIDAPVPLDARALVQAHAAILRAAEGASPLPGQLRTHAGFVGETLERARYIAPPAERVPELLDEACAALPGLIATSGALCAASVATALILLIHPFQDGNGRLSRTLFPAILKRAGLIATPALVLNAPFKMRYAQHVGALGHLARGGDWTPWISHCLGAAIDAAQDAVSLVGRRQAMAAAL